MAPDVNVPSTSNPKLFKLSGKSSLDVPNLSAGDPLLKDRKHGARSLFRIKLPGTGRRLVHDSFKKLLPAEFLRFVGRGPTLIKDAPNQDGQFRSKVCSLFRRKSVAEGMKNCSECVVRGWSIDGFHRGFDVE